jgi:peptidoglycan/LPS O-acetylase OafA/YrhL
MNFRQDIQGLRALAVIFVVIFHIQHRWLPGGYIGVDMFFVVSGFLISKGVMKQLDNQSFSYLAFVLGRVKRIVPAYFVMLLLSTFVAMFVLIPSDAETFLYQLRRTIIFTSNQVFATAEDYFGAKSYENSLLHTWSLAIEMQFYLILPLIMMSLPKYIYKWVLGIGGLIILVYTQYQLDVLDNKSAMFFSVVARSTEFVIGIAINFIPSSKYFSHKYKSFIGILALLALGISCILIDEQSHFPGLLALPACIATALLIWLEDSNINYILGSKPLAFIGKISYSLYLWHWPVLAYYRYYQGRYELTIPEVGVLLVLFLLLSIMSFYLIEESFRKSAKRYFYLFFGLLSTAVIITWYISLDTIKEVQLLERAYTTNYGFNTQNHGGNYKGYFLMGDSRKADDEILLLGDSHALVMTGFFDAVGEKNGFNFSYLSTNSIVPLDGVNDSLILPAYKKQHNEAVPIAANLVKKSNIIFVVKHWQGIENGYYKDVLKNLIDKLRPDQALVRMFQG